MKFLLVGVSPFLLPVGLAHYFDGRKLSFAYIEKDGKREGLSIKDALTAFGAVVASHFPITINYYRILFNIYTIITKWILSTVGQMETMLY